MRENALYRSGVSRTGDDGEEEYLASPAPSQEAPPPPPDVGLGSPVRAGEGAFCGLSSWCRKKALLETCMVERGNLLVLFCRYTYFLNAK